MGQDGEEIEITPIFGNYDDDKTMLKVVVMGVGGAGGNAVNNMIHSGLSGVEFVVANTDAQALAQSECETCIQLGRGVTKGLGAGSQPEIGRVSAEETLDEILSHLKGANMLFITAGMGGGTGTGASPIIAQAAREAGVLTVGVVTKPFDFEGMHRQRLAETGIAELTEHVDTLIIIPNQNLFRLADEKTTFAEAFRMADDVLHAGVRGVSDLMVVPGLVNLDFMDIRSVMTEMGKAMMGTGEAEGEDRAVAAAEAAISNPLLDDVSMKGARGVLINITGGLDLTLFEVDEAANRIREEVDPDANIIFGSTLNEKLEGKMRVSVVATGIGLVPDLSDRPDLPMSAIRNAAKKVAEKKGRFSSKTSASALAEEPVYADPEEEHWVELDGHGGGETADVREEFLSKDSYAVEPDDKSDEEYGEEALLDEDRSETVTVIRDDAENPYEEEDVIDEGAFDQLAVGRSERRKLPLFLRPKKVAEREPVAEKLPEIPGFLRR